jgi:tRNA(Arg) A34 adenosine deaminase TadA
MSDGADAWAALPSPAGRALELAHQSLLAGGLAVGSVLADGDLVVAEGRNRAYDPRTSTDPLERTPLAHAELNALARLDVDADPATLTVWSTQLPCAMCRAAIEFIGITSVFALATDPSNPAVRADEAVGHEWVVLATAMFIAGPLRRFGDRHPIVADNVSREPESVELATTVERVPAHPLVDGRALNRAVDACWEELASLAQRRAARRAG